MADEKIISRFDLPYRNLVLTGFLGVGKTTVGRTIARDLGVDFLDVDEEIEFRELMSIAKIRELYGDSRLRTLEHDYCKQASLMRRGVIIASGGALADQRNYDLLSDMGEVVVVTCELGEALRRLHMRNPQIYRDPATRGRMMSRLRREHAIINHPDLLQFDSTHLSIEAECELLITYWATGEINDRYFRRGPKPPIKAPSKKPVGISAGGGITGVTKK